ncbi:MAG: glycosyltransferase family 4 protein [Candidatus Omnitrophica bacterium]|nr:glycosyltransferase family 4 protein [Candidatus Omnitrophota bacterium]
MRLVNLLYMITKLELGGAQTQLLSLIRQLDQQRFRVFLLTATDGPLVSEAQAIPGLIFKKSRHLGRPINPFKDLLALIEIRRFIKKNDIGIVHTHSSKAGIIGRWAARLAGAGVIIHTIHGWSFNDYQPTPIRLFFIWLERFTARFTDKLIVVSGYDKQKGLDNLIGIDSKYTLIRYGIDYSEFGLQEKSIREELGIGPKDLLVGMIACFKPQKSPQDFIKLAFLVRQQMPLVKFILVGDGALRPDIERLIKRLGLKEQVILSGWRRDIPQILAALDIFVLTSLWEGLPIAALEAMASARPVVVTHTGGISEVITEGETGFLASPRDQRKLTQNLVALLKDKGLRVRIGTKAKEAMGKRFDLTAISRAHEELYLELVARKETQNAN